MYIECAVILILLLLLLLPTFDSAALNESSPDPEGAAMKFINSKPTQNSLGLADQGKK